MQIEKSVLVTDSRHSHGIRLFFFFPTRLARPHLYLVKFAKSGETKPESKPPFNTTRRERDQRLVTCAAFVAPPSRATARRPQGGSVQDRASPEETVRTQTLRTNSNKTRSPQVLIANRTPPLSYSATAANSEPCWTAVELLFFFLFFP